MAPTLTSLDADVLRLVLDRLPLSACASFGCTCASAHALRVIEHLRPRLHSTVDVEVQRPYGRPARLTITLAPAASERAPRIPRWRCVVVWRRAADEGHETSRIEMDLGAFVDVARLLWTPEHNAKMLAVDAVERAARDAPDACSLDAHVPNGTLARVLDFVQCLDARKPNRNASDTRLPVLVHSKSYRSGHGRTDPRCATVAHELDPKCEVELALVHPTSWRWHGPLDAAMATDVHVRARLRAADCRATGRYVSGLCLLPRDGTGCSTLEDLLRNYFCFPLHVVRTLASFGVGDVVAQPGVPFETCTRAVQALASSLATGVYPIYHRDAHEALERRMRAEGYVRRAEPAELEPLFA
jgi:hypothetical protein